MRKPTLCLAFSTLVLASLPTVSARAESCADFVNLRFSSIKERSLKCGIPASLIGSIKDPSSRPGLCRPRSEKVRSELGVAQECAADYCRTEAFRCAAKRLSEGSSCEEAMGDCFKLNLL